MTTEHDQTQPEAVNEAVEAVQVDGPEQEVADLKDKLLRALADVENTRRQKEREVDEARRYAVTRFARDLLDVADNLRRALAVPAAAAEENPALKSLLTGVEMTERSLLSAFERHQIKRIEPAVGEKLDPNRHQAMFEVPRADAAPGTIAEVVQAGYLIADRLLRPAMVGVAARPAEAVPETPAPGEPSQTVDTRA
ncbi:MAG TPA: nucleotide exchange factor GrpE [Geminicoccus sp.]|jgi:molecular chaperone GrpE|uniref:nucleotide exchange factor GrpE n=1 Tax=Geminicoccus sp. TaxID=2024832 RepID=UPI002E36B957|nr:nucleotide exchange factor GrpE [Geminicoccus sp.]HEX2526688.1 nucleotide exchange factor GrpE [Geminicoccus sp.]